MRRKGEAELYQDVGRNVPKIAHVLYASRGKPSEEFFSTNGPVTLQ